MNLSLVLRGQNQASPAIQQVSRHLGELTRAAEGANRALRALPGRDAQGRFVAGGGGGAGAAGMLSGLAAAAQAALGPLRLVGSLARTALGGLADAALRAASAVGQTLWASLTRVANLLGTTFLAGTAAVGAALGGLAKRGVDVNLALQRAQATFSVLFKSAPQATAFMAALRQEAAQSAFEFTDLAKHAEDLAAFGFRARDIIPTLRTLGDVARGDAQRMEQLVRAFGQIKAKGQLQGDEALQLTEAGIPVREILKIPVGLDFADAKMPAERALAQLLAGLQARFGGLQAGATQTLPGRLSNIADALNEISQSLTGGLLEQLRRAAGNTLEFLQSMQWLPAGAALLGDVRDLFDGVGGAVRRLSEQLPKLLEVVRAVADHTRRLVAGAFAGIRGALFGLRTDWAGVWAAIQGTTVQAVKIVGGTLAGLVAVFATLSRVQADGQTGFQRLAESTRNWAMSGVEAMTRYGKQVLYAAAAVGVLVAAFGLATKQYHLFAGGLVAMAAGSMGADWVGARGKEAQKALAQFNPQTALAQAAGVDPVAAFGQAYGQFGRDFDAGYQTGGGSPAPPGTAAAPQAALGPQVLPRLRGAVRMIPQRTLQIAGGTAALPAAAPTAGGGAPAAPGKTYELLGSPQDPFAAVRLPDGRVTTQWQARQAGYVPRGTAGTEAAGTGAPNAGGAAAGAAATPTKTYELLGSPADPLAAVRLPDGRVTTQAMAEKRGYRAAAAPAPGTTALRTGDAGAPAATVGTTPAPAAVAGTAGGSGVSIALQITVADLLNPEARRRLIWPEVDRRLDERLRAAFGGGRY